MKADNWVLDAVHISRSTRFAANVLLSCVLFYKLNIL